MVHGRAILRWSSMPCHRVWRDRSRQEGACGAQAEGKSPTSHPISTDAPCRGSNLHIQIMEQHRRGLGLGVGLVAAVALVTGFLVARLGMEAQLMEPLGDRPKLPLDEQMTGGIETATLAMGCFWGPDARFGVVPGVVRTRVGYAGGEIPRPTYHCLGGHAETVQVDFDPSQVSFAELLEVFFSGHNAYAVPYSSQYRSVIFYHDEAQRLSAEGMLEFLTERHGARPRTELVQFSSFTRAEDYHQKHHLQRFPGLMEELLSLYSSFEALVDATVAARLNGYVGGLGTRKQLETEINSLGLSEAGARWLRNRVR